MTAKIVNLNLETKSIDIPSEEDQIDSFKKTFAGKKPANYKYNPDFMSIAIDLAGKGFGPVEIAKACGVSETTLYRWAEDKPEFGSCWEVCRNLYRAWWERLGRDASQGKVKGFNPYTYAFQMKNRFRNEGWSDTIDNKMVYEADAPVDLNPTKTQLANIRNLIDKKIS